MGAILKALKKAFPYWISSLKKISMSLDVEDYEWYALLGCQETIKKYKPTILIELKRDNTHYKSIRNFMKELGYSSEYVGELDCLFTQ